MLLQAIETQVGGYRFRSRLEARWSIFFDALKLRWEYELEGFILSDGIKYLPDFWLADLDCYAEVKPKVFTEFEFSKCCHLGKPCILLDTSHPIAATSYYCTNTNVWLDEDGPEGYRRYLSGVDWGRVLFDGCASKKRLWFLFGEKVEDYWIDLTPEYAAKAARFEFGEAAHEPQ